MALHRDITAHCARLCGLSGERADELAGQVQDSLLHALQGAQVYLGARHLQRQRKAVRAAALRGQGYSVRDIAARLGVSTAHAYRLLTPAGSAARPTTGTAAGPVQLARGASPLRGAKQGKA